jgi:ubiquinone biosynthesis protein COQ4
MKRTGLQPDFYRKLDIKDDYSYIAMRVRQTHDIWHIITGFSTDLAGEIGLQTFTLTQTRSPLSVTLLAGTIVFALKSSISLNPLVKTMQKGWQMGESAKPFLAQKWEEDWEKPLSEWRADFNIESV